MAAMARHVRNRKRNRHGTAFWDHEYKHAEHLALSTEPSEDLKKFIRWLRRQSGRQWLNPTESVTDLGCGNGRHLIYLAECFGLRGVGYDNSGGAIAEARKLSSGYNLTYEQRSIADPLPIPDASQALVLDMMSSHFLSAENRQSLRKEIFRVLKPGGFLFMKTFLRDGDLHTRRLLKDTPAEEKNTYIHPIMGVAEHVYSEKELVDFIQENFIVHRTYPSHKHVSRGKAKKRRTICIYAEKDPYK